MTVIKPNIGDQNWGGTLNAALDSLDTGKLDAATANATYEAVHTAKAGDSLQALITAANAGDKIVIPASVALTATASVTVSKKLTISGPGSVTWTGGIAGAPALDITAAGCRILGLNLINGTGGGNTATGAAAQYGMLVEASECIIDSCVVDSFIHGIAQAKTGEWSNIQITNNRIKDVLGAGGGRGSASADGEDRGDGITIWGCQAVVTGNIINAKAGADARIGIHAEALSSAEGTQNPPHPDAMVTISGNVIYGPFRRGVVSEQVTGCSVTGNTIADATWWGIASARTSGMVVTGNTILWTRVSADNQGSVWAPNRCPLMLYGGVNSGAANIGAVFALNTVRMVSGSAADGCVYVDGPGGTDMPSDCIIESNTFINEGTTVARGVSLGSGSSNITVRSNKLLGGYTGYGIYGFGSIHPVIVGNDIVGSGTTTAGIHLESESTAPITVTGNRVSGCVTALDLSNNSFGGRVCDNEISSATTGLNGFGMQNLTVTGNTFASSVTTPYSNITDGVNGNTFTPTPPTARYYLAAAQSIPDNTATVISWDTVARQSGITNSVPVGTITLPSAGWYLIETNVRWQQNATSFRRLYVMNAAGTIIGHSEVPPAPFQTFQGLTCLAYFAAGALSFTVNVTHNVGSALNIEVYQEQTHVAVTRIRA